MINSVFKHFIWNLNYLFNIILVVRIYIYLYMIVYFKYIYIYISKSMLQKCVFLKSMY